MKIPGDFKTVVLTAIGVIAAGYVMKKLADQGFGLAIEAREGFDA